MVLEWMKTNGPYFQDSVLSWEEFFGSLGKQDNALWCWLEFGIAIFDSNLYEKGMGKMDLAQWLKQLFEFYSEILHLGFSTYSGNIGMMKLGEALGMQLESCVRKVRFWQGQWLDAIK